MTRAACRTSSLGDSELQKVTSEPWQKSGKAQRCLARRSYVSSRVLFLSKVLHGLAAGCFNIAQRRQLDAFQARCLRIMLRILPAFYSRTSNKEVLRRAGTPKLLSQLVLEQQLDLFGKVLRAPTRHVLRTCAFQVGECPVVAFFVRRTGRPRVEWAPYLLHEARRRTTSSLSDLASNRPAWWKAMRTV